MSLDFLEDACDALDKQEWPYAVLVGLSSDSTARAFHCSDKDRAGLVIALRAFADGIENGTAGNPT